MSHLAPIHYVLELAAALERGEVPSAEVCARFVGAVRRVKKQEAGDDLTLDAALGISPSQWKKDRLHRGNTMMCEARGRYLASCSQTAAAKAIIRAYGDLQRSPPGKGGELVQFVREILAVRGSFPTTTRQVENILSVARLRNEWCEIFRT